MSIYNWYFSQSGNDLIGNGSSGNPWKTLNKAQIEIDAVTSFDIANLYFNCGDTWTMNTITVGVNDFGLVIDLTNPIVNINAYGSGTKPKFYGGVSDFSTVPDDWTKSGGIGPYRWSRIINFGRNNCSISNIHFDGIYGHAIVIVDGGVDYITIDNNEFTNLGNCLLSVGQHYGTQYTQVINNFGHELNQLFVYDKMPSTAWSGTIGLSSGYQDQRQSVGNYVAYNVIYNVGGEGIMIHNGIVEYNVVGDTSSVGIYAVGRVVPMGHTIIRYNFVIMSSSNVYRDLPSGHRGIEVRDENDGGDNSNSIAEVYGNVVINRHTGISFAEDPDVTKTGFGKVAFHNNTVIDCSNTNYVIGNLYDRVNPGAGFFYNNTSILYNRPTSIHAADWGNPPDLSTYWTIDNNHFWTIGGSPIVDVDWRTNMVITDPKLSGEEQGSPVDWTGQSGATYYKDIKFSDIRPLAGSGLIGSGKVLGAGFEDDFLTTGTDFSGLPDIINFVSTSQGVSWEIGAYIFAEAPLSTPVPTTTFTTEVPTTTLTTSPPTTAPPALVVQDVVVDFATTAPPTTAPPTVGPTTLGPTTPAPAVICIKNLKSTIAKEMRLNGNLC